MTIDSLVFAVVFLSIAQAPDSRPPAAEEPAPSRRERGSLAVESFLEGWRDETRQRDVPVKIWHPAGDGPFPVIVFSHGLGGTRDSYAYLGQHWASHGYVCVHVQHVGSDDAVWRDNPQAMQAMQRAASDRDNLINRPKDISFSIDELTRRNAQEGWPLNSKLDLGSLGVAGHSFGAYTALCAAGRDLVAPLGVKLEVSDPRVKAALAMSPQGHEPETKNDTWSEFACPCFHMTGTKDSSPINGDSKPAERRIPYDTIDRADQYLLILDGGTHMAFSDTGLGLGRDPADHPLIQSGSTAFFDAYLRHDEQALAWLKGGGFAAELAKNGTFEHKDAAAPRRDQTDR